MDAVNAVHANVIHDKNERRPIAGFAADGAGLAGAGFGGAGVEGAAESSLLKGVSREFHDRMMS